MIHFQDYLFQKYIEVRTSVLFAAWFGKLPSPAAKLEINITRFMVLDPSLKEMNSQIKPSNNKLTPQPT